MLEIERGPHKRLRNRKSSFVGVPGFAVCPSQVSHFLKALFASQSNLVSEALLDGFTALARAKLVSAFVRALLTHHIRHLRKLVPVCDSGLRVAA